jgi:hypothetical protein
MEFQDFKLSVVERQVIQQHIVKYSEVSQRDVMVTATMGLMSALHVEDKKGLATAILHTLAQQQPQAPQVDWAGVVQFHYDINKDIFQAKFQAPSCCPWWKSCLIRSTPQGTSVQMEPAPIVQPSPPVCQSME